MQEVMESTNTDVFLSRFAFIFLIYAVITSGYINEILSCQMQRALTESKYFRHVLGILLVFVFIMLEGGWNMDPKQDELSDNNWSSGHVLYTLIMAFGIYFVFVLSSKSKLVPNLIFFGLVFVMYAINTQRNYWHQRKQITDEQNERWIRYSKILFAIAIVVLIYGFIDYIIYQRRAFGKSFHWSTFFLGTNKCGFEK